MKHVNDRISPTPMSTNLGKVWEPGSCLHMNPPISSIFRRASNIIPPWSGGGLSVWPNTDFPPSHVPKSVTTLSLSSQFRDLWGAPSWGTPSSSRWSRKCLAKPPNPAIPSLLAGVGSVCQNTSHRWTHLGIHWVNSFWVFLVRPSAASSQLAHYAKHQGLVYLN